MKLFEHRRLINAMLGASVLLNVAMIGYLARSGGLRRVLLKLNLVELPVTRVEFQTELEERYRKLPNTPAEVVFAGDSMVGRGPWADMLTEVHNRGIGGDTTAGLLSRLDEILDGKPRLAFLLIGTNDLASAVPEAQILANYRKILDRFRVESPKTIVNVIGVLPVNPTFAEASPQTNEQVISLNRGLKALVAEFPGVRFLDLTSYLVDDSGNLRREFSTDGLHMNVDGYLSIRKPLEEASRP